MTRKTRKTLLIIIGCLILLCCFVFSIPNTFSLYESDVTGSASLNYAMYVIKATHISQEINLGEIVPREEPYIYTFTVSNNNGSYRTDVDLEYDLSIRTTTNLPLEYELYIDQTRTDSDAVNAITSSDIIADSYGTYFLHIETPKKYFSYSENQTYTYELVVYFSENYTDSSYQDIAESIEITIDSKQIVPEN